MQDDELRHLLRRCREGGRQDWPVESLRRNLADNSTLMKVCCFPMKSNKKDCFRVLSKSAYSRFMKLLAQLVCEHGAMSALFDRNRDRLMKADPDFGTNLGFDSKKLYSYSTGRTHANGKP